MLFSSVWAAITDYHRLGVYKRKSFLTVLGAVKYKTAALAASARCLVRARFLLLRWRVLAVSSWWKGLRISLRSLL